MLIAREVVRFVKDLDPRIERLKELEKQKKEQREVDRQNMLKQKEIDKKKRNQRAREVEQERYAEIEQLLGAQAQQEEVKQKYLLV